MATTSEVKTGLDSIAADIKKANELIEAAQSKANDAKALLSAIPTNYSDVAATIDAYTPTGEFEGLAKDEKSKLVTEYQAAEARADTIIGA